MKRIYTIIWVLSCIAGITQTVTAYIKKEKKIVVFTPSYNNSEWYKKNLDSIFSQNYQNYRLVYIDDCSPDGTGDLVEQYINECGQQHRVTLIKNKDRKLAMANIYKAIHVSDDDAIMVSLDGDDWFAHDNVLQVINKAYQDPNVWMTYGNYLEWPENEVTWFTVPIPQVVVENNEFRHFRGHTAQPRTFYAWLFKQIKTQDLFYDGKFVRMSCDIAYPIPMYEMAGERFACIKEVLYIHNMHTPLNDHKVDDKLQMRIDEDIRTRPKYARVSDQRIGWFEQFNDAKSDMVIFSSQHPLRLYALLESIEKYVSGLTSIQVIHKAHKRYASAYQRIKQRFSYVQFIEQNKRQNFKTSLLHCCFNSPSNHIVFTDDTAIFTDYVDINQCIRMLEKTQAHTFSLQLGKNLSKFQTIPPHEHIEDDICAWQFDHGKQEWAKGTSLNMTLYRKANIKKPFETLAYNNPSTLEKQWAAQCVPASLGLFFEHSKAIHLMLLGKNKKNPTSLTMPASQLLKTFNAGYKMDIKPLFGLHNKTTRMGYKPKFVKQ